jgi:hypothetical protein
MKDPLSLHADWASIYGREYADFLLVDHSSPPKLCPKCKAEAIRKLWLGDPGAKMGDSVWGKWYLWCGKCLTGIYCPFGTHVVPVGEPYLRWGDEAALNQALPSGLHLIRPETELPK